MVCVAAISGCAAMRSPPEPAVPTSRTERIPLNKTDADLAAALPVRQGAERITRGPAEDPSNDKSQALTWRFVHGAARPVLLCAAGHVCDLELQPGERISEHIRIGDKARWGLDVVYAKQAGAETVHLLLTPSEPGIETSMVILTNRRTYHLQLRATRNTSMLHTVFAYPDEMQARWRAVQGAEAETK